MRKEPPEPGAGEGIRSVTDRVLRGLRPTDPPPAVADMRALLDVGAGPSPRAWADAGARTLEAMLASRARLDDLDGAMSLLDTHFLDGRLRAPGTLSSSTRSTLLAAAAEVCAAAGRPRRAGLYAAAAVASATSPVTRYRAHAVRALAYALNGEYESAGETVARCRELERTAGRAWRFRDYTLLLAEILLASAALDPLALDRLAGELRTTAPDDPFWQYCARSAEAMRALVTHEYVEGMSLLSTLVGGADALNSHAMVRGFTLGVLADTLLARGEVRRALAVLDGIPSPSEHALCYQMQRSAAYLALGRDRSALASTDACIAMGPEHCVRTLVPVLVRRAVAHLRLGNAAAALVTFEEAFFLGESLGGSLTPYIALPQRDLDTLLTTLARHRPSAATAVERLRATLAGVPTRTPRRRLPALSPREERLAMLLRGSRTIRQIADELNVSVNTIKSQLRSIYAKLAVSGREEAVAVLESHGFYV